MSVLRHFALVGLFTLVGCSHGVREPATPASPEPPRSTAGSVDLRALETLPEVRGGVAPSSRPRVDTARTHVNSAFASLVMSQAELGFIAPPRRPAYAMALSPTCRTSADCGGGAFSCRAREDGVRVCMGQGSPGDACWFASDCVSGTCTDDGVQRTCR